MPIEDYRPNADAEALVRSANDSNKERRSRCGAVFRLFAYYVRSGFSSSDIGKFLGDAQWLQGDNIHNAGALGGAAPFFSRGGESEFLIILFPNEKGWSEWRIYFTLSHPPSRLLDMDGARAFLRGALPDRQVRLQEFALCYPFGKTERFTKHRVGVQFDESTEEEIMELIDFHHPERMVPHWFMEPVKDTATNSRSVVKSGVQNLAWRQVETPLDKSERSNERQTKGLLREKEAVWINNLPGAKPQLNYVESSKMLSWDKFPQFPSASALGNFTFLKASNANQLTAIPARSEGRCLLRI
jgi:hypothetical protein